MIAAPPGPSAPFLTPDDIVREVRHLPSAPKVLPRLKQLLSDTNSGMQEIVGLIRLDPGIAARVLQVSNSAYFSKGVRCVTIDEAVNRVGYDQIYELVSFAVASQVLVRPLEVYRIEADDLWQISVATALAAEMLADRTGQDRSVAYTIGLLHRVGMVAINEWALRNFRGLVFKSAAFPRDATENEQAALGFTQAEVGAALLTIWEFPESFTEPVLCQYAPAGAVDDIKMAVLLHAAKWLGYAAVGQRPAGEAGHLHRLGLPFSALAAMTSDVVERLAAVDGQLETTAGPVSDRQRFPAQKWPQ